jgi:hypothetical protein
VGGLVPNDVRQTRCPGLPPGPQYASGFVCLSLLGTWSGPGWEPYKSNLLQLLLSLQRYASCPCHATRASLNITLAAPGLPQHGVYRDAAPQRARDGPCRGPRPHRGVSVCLFAQLKLALFVHARRVTYVHVPQAYNEQIRYVCMRHAIHAHVAAIAAADQSQDGDDAGMLPWHGYAADCMCWDCFSASSCAERRPCLLFRRSVCENKAADQGSAGPQRYGQRRGVPRCVAGRGSGYLVNVMPCQVSVLYTKTFHGHAY